MFKGLNIIEFSERFATDDVCRKYLSEIKWKNGYQLITLNIDFSEFDPVMGYIKTNAMKML
jgi:hypothetical protein